MIELQAVSFERAGKTIISELNLTVNPGELLVIVGPNGAGKSTLLQLLSGWHPPSSGDVRLNAKRVSSYTASERSQQLGFLTQFNPVAFDFRVEELASLGMEKVEASKFEEILFSLQLTGLAKRKYHSLSGGEQQRVHWARVLLQFKDTTISQICLMDEPTSHLDVGTQRACLNYLKSLLSPSFGLVLVLHDLNLAMRYADKIMLLNQGDISYLGDPGSSAFLDSLSRAYGVNFEYVSNLPNAPCQLVF